VLAGKLYAETLPGFVHPAPLALIEHGIKGKSVVYSTTNGTVAMTLAAGASRIYCGALLNAQRLVDHVLAAHPRETVLLVCSGSGNNFNFEDFYGAGCFVERFAARLGPSADLSDAARAARMVFRASEIPQALLDCRLGRMMTARGLRHEVEFAGRMDAFPVVPALDAASLRLVA
jgi:2-phosphosulfolactate phosphatase